MEASSSLLAVFLRLIFSPTISSPPPPSLPPSRSPSLRRLRLFSRDRSSPPRRSQNQSSPRAHAPPPPPPFVWSALSAEGGGGWLVVGGWGGGVSVQPAEVCSEGGVDVTERRCSHQRIHRETQRHLALSILALPPSAERLHHRFLLLAFSAPPGRHATPRAGLGRVGGRRTACFCEPMPQVNARLTAEFHERR